MCERERESEKGRDRDMWGSLIMYSFQEADMNFPLPRSVTLEAFFPLTPGHKDDPRLTGPPVKARAARSNSSGPRSWKEAL